MMSINPIFLPMLKLSELGAILRTAFGGGRGVGNFGHDRDESMFEFLRPLSLVQSTDDNFWLVQRTTGNIAVGAKHQ